MRPVSNPPNPWASADVVWLDEPPPARLELFEERAKSVVSENDSPDVAFRYSVNPYRGCIHACAYCYARPSHQYLGYGAGTDFDRKIVVKVNAPELLEEAFAARGWTGDAITFSGNTDCYQPIEASYAITRRCLEVCHAFRNPVGIITKGALIERDGQLLLVRNVRRDDDGAIAPMHQRGMSIESPTPAERARWESVFAHTRARLVGTIADAAFVQRIQTAARAH